MSGQISSPLTKGITLSDIEFTIEETDLWVNFSFVNNYRFDNPHHLFEVLRDAYSKHLNGAFLMIKYASRWEGYNAPVMHDPAKLITILDPLLPYRDPVIDVQRTKFIGLIKVASMPFFYRRKSSMKELQAIRSTFPPSS